MTELSPFAVAREEDGLMAYVVADTSFGKTHERIEWAASLKEAKYMYGRSGMRYTTTTIRRARAADVEALS